LYYRYLKYNHVILFYNRKKKKSGCETILKSDVKLEFSLLNLWEERVVLDIVLILQILNFNETVM